MDSIKNKVFLVNTQIKNLFVLKGNYYTDMIDCQTIILAISIIIVYNIIFVLNPVLFSSNQENNQIFCLSDFKADHKSNLI